jgi:AAA15 family ATPase/GTPase
MLVEFGVENFRSIAVKQSLSMVARRDDSLSETLIKRDKQKFLPTAAIFGANASGKSNLLKALGFLRQFVATSATQMNLGDPLPWVVPFRLDSKWQEKPSRFEITAIIHGSRYEYAVALTPKYVQSESLYVTRPGGRRAKRFTREFNANSQYTDWDLPGVSRKEEKLLTGKTRDNGLLLSRAAELNFQLAQELFLWFAKSLWIFDLSQATLLLVQQSADMISKDGTLKERVLRMLKDADVGIKDIHTESKQVVLPKAIPDPVKKMLADMSAVMPMQTIDVRTMHFTSDQTPVYFSLQDDESQGTQRLFAIAGPIINALDHGATIVIDELECSMHPNLTEKIVALFESTEANPRGGQLIFATHDTSLMRPSLLRRDQMWIAQKKSKGNTELYSLFDFDYDKKPRKNEAFQKNYLSGQYGGIAQFGPIFEDQEKP